METGCLFLFLVLPPNTIQEIIQFCHNVIPKYGNCSKTTQQNKIFHSLYYSSFLQHKGTQTADAEVNRAFKNGGLLPSCVDTGSIRRKLPIKMTRRNLNMTTRKGDLLSSCKSCHISLHLLIRLYLFFISSLSIYSLKEVLMYRRAY